MTTIETPIEKAIRQLGTQAKLARAIGQTPQFIRAIKLRGGKIPTQKVSADEWAKATGLSKRELFPEFQD